MPAPTKDQPIVLWRDTKAPITDWRGERDNYFALSNQLTIRCLFTPASNAPQ